MTTDQTTRWRALLRRRPPTIARWACFVAAFAVFVVLLFARGGPNPAEVDAKSVTEPAAAISHGEIAAAVRATAVPDPPGYPLLTAPLVAVLRPWVGSPHWCSDKPFPSVLRGNGLRFYATVIGPCSGPESTVASRARPHWYRSQAVLAVLAWVLLTVGAVALLRAAGARRGWGEAFLVLLLAALPAANDAITQSFHPQDMASVGFACLALALVLGGRTAAGGIAFAAGFLCKQFAILPLVAAVVAVGGWRARTRLLLCFAGVVSIVMAPFEFADPSQFPHTISGVYVVGAGIVHSPTLLGLLPIAEQMKLELTRDLPVLVAAVVAVLARWRWREHLLEPVALIGLATACMALRLVFEVALLDYYFLAVATLLLILDFALARPPALSAGWILSTRFVLAPAAPHLPSSLTAMVFAGLACAPVAIGLAAIQRQARASAARGTALGVVARPRTQAFG